MRGISCVKGEIHNVLAVLRVSGRGYRSFDGSYSKSTFFDLGTTRDEHIEALRYKLVAAFKELHGYLGFYSDLHDIDTCTLLRPFNDLLLSDLKGVDVLNVTLSAILKFLQYELIDEESPSVATALHTLLQSVCSASFDCHSRDDIELVHIRSMEVLLEMLRSPAGYMFSDEDVCKLVQKIIDVRHYHVQSGGSSMMRRYTENVLAQVVMFVFSQLVDDDLIMRDYRLLRDGEASKLLKTRSFIHPRASSSHRRRIKLTAATATQRRDTVHLATSPMTVSSEIRLPTITSSKKVVTGSVAVVGDDMERVFRDSAEMRTDEIKDTSKSPVSAATGSSACDSLAEALAEEMEVSPSIQPFGVPCMVRIFKFLMHLINPNVAENTADVREFGLRLINVALETSGRFLNNHSELVAIIQDDLCRQLLANSQSQHFGVLSLVLRVIFDLFNAVKEAIRVQLEVFFISIHLRIAESDSSSFEQRELVLESLVEFSREPDLIVGLYTNYDCRVGSTHLFEDLCKFLSQQSMPRSVHDLNDLHLIAAEGILAIIDCIARKFLIENPYDSTFLLPVSYRRAESGLLATDGLEVARKKGVSDSGDDSSPEPASAASRLKMESQKEMESEMEEIRRQQKLKRRLKLAGKQFNAKGHKAFEYLQQIGELDSPLTAQSVASFLQTNPYLDKIQMGVFFGKNKPFHTQVLAKYLERYDFSSLQIDEALRLFLESFVLRGEAEQISRIIECFANTYFASQKTQQLTAELSAASASLSSLSAADISSEEGSAKSKRWKKQLIANPDSAFLLAFSIIQLNTDAHNDQVPKKMSLDSYKRNLRGLNGGDDFDGRFVARIYHSITSNEIRIRSGDPRDIFVEGCSAPFPGGYDSDNESSASEHLYETESGGGSLYDVKGAEWKQVLKKSRAYGKFSIIAPHSTGKDMFEILWQPALRILEFHLQHAAHPKVLDRVAQGLTTLARIAHCYQIRDAFNALIDAICSNLMVNLLHFAQLYSLLPATFEAPLSESQSRSAAVPYFLSAPEGDSQWSDGKKPSLEDASFQLALNIRITFVLKILFSLVRNYGGLLLDGGWPALTKLLLWLLHLDLLPRELFEMEDFMDSKGDALPSFCEASARCSAVPQSAEPSVSGWLQSTWTALFAVDSTQQSRARLLRQSPPTAATKATRVQHPDNAKCQYITEELLCCELTEVFSESKYFHVNTLMRLVRTLIAMSAPSSKKTLTSSDPNPVDTSTLLQLAADDETVDSSAITDHSLAAGYSGGKPKRSAPKEDMVCMPLSVEMKVFCLERLGQLVIANLDRLQEIWAPVLEHYKSVLQWYADGSDSRHCVPDFLFERVVVHILRLCSYLCDVSEPRIRSEVRHLVSALSKLSDYCLFAVGRHVVAGLKLLLSMELASDSERCIRSKEDWKTVLNLLQRFAHCEEKLCTLEAFQLIEAISKEHLSAANYESVLCTLKTFPGSEQLVVDATRVIRVMSAMLLRIPQLSATQLRLATMWRKTIRAVARFGADKQVHTRRCALDCLQKAVLQQPLQCVASGNAETWRMLFVSLLPLLLQTTKLENERFVHVPMVALKEADDLRLKLLTMIFQILNQHVDAFVKLPEFCDTWYRFLSAIRGFLVLVANNDSLVTHCTEWLKNAILVTQSTGFFKHHSAVDAWAKTWSILVEVTPALKEEIQPPTAAQTDEMETKVGSV